MDWIQKELVDTYYVFDTHQLFNPNVSTGGHQLFQRLGYMLIVFIRKKQF